MQQEAEETQRAVGAELQCEKQARERLAARLDELSQELVAAQRDLSSVSEERAALQREVSVMDKSQAVQRDEFRRLENEQQTQCAEYQARLDDLTDANRQLERELRHSSDHAARLEAELSDAVQQPRFSTLVGLRQQLESEGRRVRLLEAQLSSSIDSYHKLSNPYPRPLSGNRMN